MVEIQGIDDTKFRILNIAEKLFAEKGYEAVGIREITSKAGCNISAINYHFGNKKNLYLEVFKKRFTQRARRIREAYRKNLSECGDDSLEKVLDALARAFFEGPLSDDEKRYHAQLIMREMIKPTEAIEFVIKNVMKPFIEELVNKLSEFVKTDSEREKMVLNLLSFISMIIYFNFARFAVSRITGEEYDQNFRKRLIKHIVDFSIKGISGVSKEQEMKKKLLYMRD